MKILFATDGSETAQAALDFVQAFPFPDNSDITLLTVIDRDNLPDADRKEFNEEQRASLRETEEAMRETCEDVLAKEAERLRKAGWAGTRLVRYGHPADEIVRAAEELDSELVVLGSHGHTGITQYLLGSVSSTVLAHAPCSVLIAKGAHAHRAAGDHFKLLLAYDESPSAEKAVDFCAELPLGEKTEVTVIDVLPLVTLFRQDVVQRLSWYWQQQKRTARDALERVTREVRWATPNVDYMVLESGDVTNAILNTATDLDSDLIVVGHKGTGAIEKFLIGSVAARIGHHADRSVLAIRN
jgi:nucleotide-binding universal stress UspA family protein